MTRLLLLLLLLLLRTGYFCKTCPISKPKKRQHVLDINILTVFYTDVLSWNGVL